MATTFLLAKGESRAAERVGRCPVWGSGRQRPCSTPASVCHYRARAHPLCRRAASL